MFCNVMPCYAYSPYCDQGTPGVSTNFTSQGALLAAGLMGAVSAGLVPVVKVKKAA